MWMSAIDAFVADNAGQTLDTRLTSVRHADYLPCAGR
jgi:hypothetical protein